MPLHQAAVKAMLRFAVTSMILRPFHHTVSKLQHGKNEILH